MWVEEDNARTSWNKSAVYMMDFNNLFKIKHVSFMNIQHSSSSWRFFPTHLNKNMRKSNWESFPQGSVWKLTKMLWVATS